MPFEIAQGKEANRYHRRNSGYLGQLKSDKRFHDKYAREHSLASLAWRLRNPKEAEFLNRVKLMTAEYFRELREADKE